MLPLHALALAVTLAWHVHKPAPSLIVEARATPLGEAALFSVLERTAGRVSRQRVLFVWALVALENARGSKVFNGNLGNVGPSSRRARRFLLRDGGYYQAFASPRAGAVRLWQVLNRCSAAMASFDAGDGMAGATSLRRCGYHRTDPKRYGAALRSLYWEASRRWPVRGTGAPKRRRATPTFCARREETNR